jgi:CBS domain containing-hemolysin-like protein
MPLFTLFLVISIFLIFSEYLHFILGRILGICRLLPMTFFSTKYKVLSKHFWNTLIVWFILLTEISKCWNECFVLLLPLLKMHCKSAKKFTPWQIRQSSASFTNNIDKNSYAKIKNLINCQIQHTLDLSKLQLRCLKNVWVNAMTN